MSPYLRRLRAAVGHDLLLVPSVTGIAFDDRDRILVARSADTGEWVAPGGAVDPGEHPADALRRELREELGVEARPVRLLGAWSGPEFAVVYPNGDRVIYVATVYECTLDAAPRLHDDELLELAWAGPDDLGSLDLAAWARVVLPRVWDARAAPVI